MQSTESNFHPDPPYPYEGLLTGCRFWGILTSSILFCQKLFYKELHPHKWINRLGTAEANFLSRLWSPHNVPFYTNLFWCSLVWEHEQCLDNDQTIKDNRTLTRGSSTNQPGSQITTFTEIGPQRSELDQVNDCQFPIFFGPALLLTQDQSEKNGIFSPNQS